VLIDTFVTYNMIGGRVLYMRTCTCRASKLATVLVWVWLVSSWHEGAGGCVCGGGEGVMLEGFGSGILP
jgi:hypothetical protein